MRPSAKKPQRAIRVLSPGFLHERRRIVDQYGRATHLPGVVAAVTLTRATCVDAWIRSCERSEVDGVDVTLSLQSVEALKGDRRTSLLIRTASPD